MSLDFYIVKVEPVHVYSANYTHNVTPMWELAGVYDALYNSEGKKASEITETLENGLAHMEANRDLYRPLNPENGWGSYSTALQFLRNVLVACKEHPDGEIEISK